MPTNAPSSAPLCLAELIAALSLATDLGMQMPLEHMLCTCVLSVRLGEALGLSESELREVYYLAVGGINMVRVAGGKIAENWPNIDMLGILQQLGVVPAPGQ